MSVRERLFIELNRFLGLTVTFWLTVAFCLSQANAATVRISNLNDINLGDWNAISDVTGNDNVCIYSSDSDAYKVRPTDTSTINPTSLSLENFMHTHEIPYDLKWNNTASPGSLAMSDGVDLNTNNADTISDSCSGGVNANFKIEIDHTDLGALPAGTYTGTISFEVNP